MKTFFSFLHRGYLKQLDREDRLLESKPNNFDECVELAKEAVDLSRYKDPRSKQLWLHVITVANSLGLDLKNLFEVKLSDGGTILKACIDAKDWDSCLEFISALPEGQYCDGRIVRKNMALILNEDGFEKQKGILATPQGFYYAGDLKAGQKHGNGILTARDENVFEGEFKNDQMHGWGAYRKGNSKRVYHEGIFIEGIWKGNPRQGKPFKSRGITSYFCR